MSSQLLNARQLVDNPATLSAPIECDRIPRGSTKKRRFRTLKSHLLQDNKLQTDGDGDIRERC